MAWHYYDNDGGISAYWGVVAVNDIDHYWAIMWGKDMLELIDVEIWWRTMGAKPVVTLMAWQLIWKKMITPDGSMCGDLTKTWRSRPWRMQWWRRYSASRQRKGHKWWRAVGRKQAWPGEKKKKAWRIGMLLKAMMVFMAWRPTDVTPTAQANWRQIKMILWWRDVDVNCYWHVTMGVMKTFMKSVMTVTFKRPNWRQKK